MPYDPQRSRHRPPPAEDDRPAPVDALLEGHPPEPPLPEGVELDVTDGGEVVVHTADADVEVTPSGDDVVVRTGDASVEVRAADDEVVVTTGDEELYVDTSPPRRRAGPSPGRRPSPRGARRRWRSPRWWRRWSSSCCAVAGADGGAAGDRVGRAQLSRAAWRSSTTSSSTPMPRT